MLQKNKNKRSHLYTVWRRQWFSIFLAPTDWMQKRWRWITPIVVDVVPAIEVDQDTVTKNIDYCRYARRFCVVLLVNSLEFHANSKTMRSDRLHSTSRYVTRSPRLGHMLLPWQQGSAPQHFAWFHWIGNPRKPPSRPKHLRSICHTSRLIGDFVQLQILGSKFWALGAGLAW